MAIAATAFQEQEQEHVDRVTRSRTRLLVLSFDLLRLFDSLKHHYGKAANILGGEPIQAHTWMDD